MDFKTKEKIREQIEQAERLWQEGKYEEAKPIEQLIEKQLAQFRK